MKRWDFRVRAPGRINLIGEHIDYLDGFVLPAAIDPSIEIEAREVEGSRKGIVQSSIGNSPSGSIYLDGLTVFDDPDDHWLNYITGVLAGYRRAGFALPGFECRLSASLPVGAGLSASAALETGIALMIETFNGRSLSTRDRALLCQRAEHEYAGVPCGIMDQLSIGAGQANHALLIDCRSLEIEPVSIPDDLVIVVADTGVKHALADGEYRRRRNDCETALQLMEKSSWRDVLPGDVDSKQPLLGDRLFRRSRHAVSEMKRVGEFADCLRCNDRDGMGALMLAGHDSLRKDFEVSCPELDELVEAAYEFGSSRGLIGSRMTGGGFGGATVSLVDAGEAEPYMEHLRASFFERFGSSLHCFTTVASAGAVVQKELKREL